MDVYEQSSCREFNTSLCLKTIGLIKERLNHNVHAPYFADFVGIKLMKDQEKQNDVHNNLKGRATSKEKIYFNKIYKHYVMINMHCIK